MTNNIPTDPLVKAGYIINEIVRIIELPGEDYSDGECLDLMIQLLERCGYEFNFKAFSYRGEAAKGQGLQMNTYYISETYEYKMLYEVEANSEDEALELISDDPFEYRNFEAEDPDHELTKREVEKA